MIYLPTDTLADWNGVLNGHKVYDYEASKHCPPETKALVDSIMGRPEPIPKSVRDLCAQVHLDIVNAESQIPQPNPDYVESPLKVSMLKVVDGEVITGVTHSTEEIGKFLKKD